VVGEVLREAHLFGKGSQVAVLAGSPFVTEIFEQLGCQLVYSFHQAVTYLITLVSG